MKRIVSVGLKQICFCSGASKSFESFRKAFVLESLSTSCTKNLFIFQLPAFNNLLIGPFSLLADFTINLVLNSKQAGGVLRNRRYTLEVSKMLQSLRRLLCPTTYNTFNSKLLTIQTMLSPSRTRLLLASKIVCALSYKTIDPGAFITSCKGMRPACCLWRQRLNVLWGQMPSLLKTGLYTGIQHNISITLPLYCTRRLRKELNIYLQHNYDSSSVTPSPSVYSPLLYLM